MKVTTVYLSQPNVLVERFQCEMNATSRAQSNPSRGMPIHLPVLLDIKTSAEVDLQCSPKHRFRNLNAACALVNTTTELDLLAKRLRYPLSLAWNLVCWGGPWTRVWENIHLCQLVVR